MVSLNFNSSTRKPLILVSPLDWGLGHTTRCIPLIQTLLDYQCQVLIGCNSTQREIFHQEFGTTVDYLPLEGYDIQYGKTRRSTFLKLVLQSFKILIRIKQERRWLQRMLATHPIELIISDNRFGLYARTVPSIFITHQLQIKTGLGKVADGIARRWNYRGIKHFTNCWVPDQPNEPSLAGALSHPIQEPPFQLRYIGPISRFKTCPPTLDNNLLIILSGPEPQRSLFEQSLLRQLETYKGRVVLVRGVPLASTTPVLPAHCTVYNHAPASLLQRLICEARLVIGRCGYTSVMDLLALQKKTILVPTPGQAEQEYLAAHLQQQGWALTMGQEGFSFSDALHQAREFPYQFPPLPLHGYKQALKDSLNEILQKKRADPKD